MNDQRELERLKEDNHYAALCITEPAIGSKRSAWLSWRCPSKPSAMQLRACNFSLGTVKSQSRTQPNGFFFKRNQKAKWLFSGWCVSFLYATRFQLWGLHTPRSARQALLQQKPRKNTGQKLQSHASLMTNWARAGEHYYWYMIYNCIISSLQIWTHGTNTKQTQHHSSKQLHEALAVQAPQARNTFAFDLFCPLVFLEKPKPFEWLGRADDSESQSSLQFQVGKIKHNFTAALTCTSGPCWTLGATRNPRYLKVDQSDALRPAASGFEQTTWTFELGHFLFACIQEILIYFGSSIKLCLSALPLCDSALWPCAVVTTANKDLTTTSCLGKERRLWMQSWMTTAHWVMKLERWRLEKACS